MDISATRQASSPAGRARFSFLLKIFLAVSLVGIADILFFDGGGSTLGAYAGLLLLASCLVRPALGRSAVSLVAIGFALLFAVALFVDPSLLAFAMFWAAASIATLLPRARFDDGWRWSLRIALQILSTPFLPFRDIGRLKRVKSLRPGTRGRSRFPVLALPVAGSIVFLALFARANPLIGDAFASVDLGALFGGLSPSRLLFWALVLMLAWSLLRPSMHRLTPRVAADGSFALPGVSLASVTLSLFAFNGIFAVQNGLDIVFLWSGAPLPHGLTLAEYAHRGAYPLIATALLAALFVLVTLRPGSDMAASPLVRRLVYLWIAQNVLLVASTMLRTLDYVEAYSLTVLRISALLWMGLVAIGLVLICWRLWRGKSAAWLINANMAAALLLLGACTWVDLGASAAAWNVRHAKEAGGRGAALDLCYLHELGEAALLPIVALESRRPAPLLRERLAWLREGKMAELETQQANWRTWTVRGARRLAAARAAIVAHRLPRGAHDERSCDGVPHALTAPVAR